MVVYNCPKCFKKFTKKYNYDIHLNKKIPCTNNNVIEQPNIIMATKNTPIKRNNNIMATKNTPNIQNKNIMATKNTPNDDDIGDDLTCEFCNKIYSRKDVLKKHIFNNCKNKKMYDADKQEQIKLLIEQNQELKKQNELLKQNINQSNITINNNNFIQIFQFGKEDLSQINDTGYLDIVKNIKSIGTKLFTDIITHIHFNPTYPQFQNIYISDINREKCMIYDGNKWNLTNLSDDNFIIPHIIEKTVDFTYLKDAEFKNIYKNNKYIQDRLNVINKYITKCDDDYIDELNENEENKIIVKECKDFKNGVSEKLKLLLYNQNNIITKKK